MQIMMMCTRKHEKKGCLKKGEPDKEIMVIHGDIAGWDMMHFTWVDDEIFRFAMD